MRKTQNIYSFVQQLLRTDNCSYSRTWQSLRAIPTGGTFLPLRSQGIKLTFFLMIFFFFLNEIHHDDTRTLLKPLRGAHTKPPSRGSAQGNEIPSLRGAPPAPSLGAVPVKAAHGEGCTWRWLLRAAGSVVVARGTKAPPHLTPQHYSVRSEY